LVGSWGLGLGFWWVGVWGVEVCNLMWKWRVHSAAPLLPDRTCDGSLSTVSWEYMTLSVEWLLGLWNQENTPFFTMSCCKHKIWH